MMAARAGIFLVLCVLLAALMPASVAAQEKGWQRLQEQGFQVEIKASTKLSFFIRRDANGRPVLSGKLTDDRGKGLPGQSLRMQMPNGKQLLLRTGEKGTFRHDTKGWPKRGSFAMFFQGAKGYGASRRSRKLDLRRVDLEIHANFPPPLAAGSHRFVISARLSYKGQPLRRFPLTLYLGKPQAQDQTGPPDPKDLWPLMTLRSDRQGELRFVWEGRALEGPASLPLVLGYAGGRFFLPQRRMFRLIITSPPHDERSYWWWSIALLSVVLLGAGIFGGQFVLQYLRNKQDGNGIHHLPKARALIDLPSLDDLGVGPSVKDDTLLAGWILDSASREPIAGAHIVVEQAPNIPKSAPRDEKNTEESAATSGAGASQDAQVALVESSSPKGTKSDEHGRFVLPFSAFGEVRLRIYHPYYRAKKLTIQLPHQGSGRRLQVQITSYRELIFRVFAQAIWRVVPEQNIDPQRRTAREVLREAEPPQAAQLAPLASLFEESYYGPEMPEAELYTQAAEQLASMSETTNTEQAQSAENHQA